MGKKTNTTAIGKKLEDEVADIYRQIDGVIKVIQNTNIEGIQVDVYVELESRDGVINRCAIDAKNYKKAVDSCRVRECINNFKLLRDKNKVDQGLVVAENGFAQDAHATAREISGFKLVDIKDLRQKAFNFSPYLEKWIQLYEGNEIFLKNLYIPLTAKKEEENKVVPLDNYLLEWLNEETMTCTRFARHR